METLTRLEDLLSTHPFLVGLDPVYQAQLEFCATLRRFGSQQEIFQEGGEADHFYLILSGKVVLETKVPGYQSLAIETLGAGEALGWSWLFPPYRWCFTATTAAPTEVISFGAEFLRQKVQAEPEFGQDLLRRVVRTLIQRLQVTRQVLVHSYTELGRLKRD